MAVLNVNGKSLQANADPRTPLLWVLRDTLGMTGTKYGCGIAQCGSCTVHIDGVAVRSCQVPLSAVSSGKKVVTIEGLAQDGKLNKIQEAWLANDVPPVRLLPERHDHGGHGIARGQAQPDRRRYRRGHDQRLPLRDLPAGPRGDPRRSQGLREKRS